MRFVLIPKNGRRLERLVVVDAEHAAGQGRPLRNQPDRDEFGEAEWRNKGIAPYVLIPNERTRSWDRPRST